MKRDSFQLASARFALGLCLVWAAAYRAPAADLPKGLVLYFSFDQAATNGVVADLSSQKNAGQVSGAKWIAAGKQGGAYEFAPSNAFIRVANRGPLNMKKMTLAVWFKTAKADAAWRRILDKRSGRGYALSIAGDSPYNAQSRGRLAFHINGRFLCLSDNLVTDGAWHHGAATFDGAELDLYVDGVLQRQTTLCREEVAANLDDLTIGMNRTNPEPQEKNRSFDGVLDEVMVFDRALSSAEIRTLVAAVDPSIGKPKFTKQQVASRLRELKLLYEEGLLTDKFYDEKVAECEVAEESVPPAAATNAPVKKAK